MKKRIVKARERSRIEVTQIVEDYQTLNEFETTYIDATLTR